MASRSISRHYDRVDPMFSMALLFSLGLHTVALFVMSGLQDKPHRVVDTLSVQLQQAPKPLPPPEPPKPEPEPPKPPAKKLPPPVRPQPIPPPPVESPTPVSVRQDTPPPPAVIAAAPKANEPPPTFTAPPAPPPPPEPPKPKGPTDQEIDSARGNYGSLLSREFAKHKQYPRIAQMRGWQGIAKVELHIDANGNVISSTVSESSGFEVLDKQALEMVRKASPLPLPPENLRGREFTIIVPIAFRLE
jgi:periplasmic protein TonB